MKFRIFGVHTPKPKRFTYQPRFYDEVAERHRRLEEKYAQSAAVRPYDETHINEAFDAIRSKRKHPAQSVYASGFRIFIIALALCILIYICCCADLTPLISKIQNIF